MNLKKLKNLEPKVIGHIGVDAGVVWIGDPCYILHTDKLPDTLGKDWDDFCDKLKNNKYSKSFNYQMGHEGLGVCTSTKYGDGVYNVIGFFEVNNEHPSCVIIDFDGVFEDDEETDEFNNTDDF